MAKEPDQRFSNAQEFATALSEVANEAGIAVEGGRSSMVSVNGDLASYLAANTDGVAKARAASQPNFSEGNQGKAAQSAYGSTAMDWERSGDDALKASLNKNQLKPVWLAGGALLLGAAVAVFAFAGNDKATPVEEKPVLGAPAEDIAASSKSAEEVAKLAEIEMRKKVEAQFAAEQLEAKKKTEAARLAEEAKLAEVASQTAAAKPQNSPKPAPRRAVAAPAPAPTPAPAPAPAPVVSKPATPKPPVDELGY